MSRNGSGTYSLPAGNPVVTGTTVSSTWANNTLSDIATALTGSIAADGQTPVTANIPMNSKKITGLAAGTTSGDALSYGQAINGTTGTFSGLVSGATGSFSGDVTLGGTTTGKGISLVAYKTSTTTRSSTITLADDPHLVVALTAGTWQVTAFMPIWTTTSSAGGLKYTFAFSGTATGQIGQYGGFNSTLTVYNSFALGGVTSWATIATGTGIPTIDYVQFTGTVIVTVGGNLSFQWAQNSSNVNAANVSVGSFLSCTKLF